MGLFELIKAELLKLLSQKLVQEVITVPIMPSWHAPDPPKTLPHHPLPRTTTKSKRPLLGLARAAL